jgi:hypothetical protein
MIPVLINRLRSRQQSELELMGKYAQAVTKADGRYISTPHDLMWGRAKRSAWYEVEQRSKGQVKSMEEKILGFGGLWERKGWGPG